MRTPIPPALFDFLRDLRAHNDRAWFAANRHRYEAEARGPMLDFIRWFEAPLAAISPHFVASTRPVGGSLFRIHRDTRFSRDKSPYKTNVGAHFRHEAGKDAHAPGFYLHLEPDVCFAGFGIWRPDAAATARIRGAIAERPKEWTRITTAPDFTATLDLRGDSLKRPPRGFDPGHPLIEHLKRKDFIAATNFAEAEVTRPEFPDRFAETARRAAPFVQFLSRAVGVPF